MSKQYGTWKSPITPQKVAAGIRLYDVQWDTEDNTLVWVEGRAGKSVLVAQHEQDAPRDLTDGAMSVRGRVGYGGGTFTVADKTVFFVGDKGRLYRVPIDGGKLQAITPAFGGASSPRVSPDGQWVAFVHTYEGQDGIGLIDAHGKLWPRKLFFGTDFVMQPTWHPQGTYIAFVSWDHPNMPWDGTRLHLAKLAIDDTGVPYIDSMQIVEDLRDTAIFQPEFSPDGRYLSYMSDKSGYGQLYLLDLQNNTHHQVTHAEAEHATPAWIQGMRTYAWTPDAHGVYVLRNERGFYSLYHYSLETDTTTCVNALKTYTHMEQIAVSSEGTIAMLASGYATPPRVITYDAEDETTIHRRSDMENIPAAQFSAPESTAWRTTDDDTAYGLYYPPAGEGAGGLPPLVIYVHGGPTSQKLATYDTDAQFFATRGYAVLMVNHRGGTGYGREYMLKLRGQWGVVDVDDCKTGAEHLINAGKVDAERVVIMGGSAGGYTVLQSLVTYPGFYAAGISRYGIANQFMLVQDTHKFEARYNDSLIGPLPDAADLYRERSPIFHVDKLRDPLLIFQGEEDTVVPKNQSDTMVKALRARGIPHEYHVYAGEGHGFRKPETLTHYYEQMVAFLSQYVIYK